LVPVTGDTSAAGFFNSSEPTIPAREIEVARIKEETKEPERSARRPATAGPSA